MAQTRQFPLVLTPDGDDVETAVSKMDNEFNAVISGINSIGALNLSGTKRQSVLHGSTDASGNPNYLTASGLNVSIDGSTVPIILAFANGFNDSGSVDVLDKISSAISNAYTLPPNQTAYLYVDKDINNGLLSYGYTLYPDQYLKAAPSSPVLDQHYFNTVEMKMYRYNGSAWEVKQRIFLAKAVTDASNITLTTYPFGARFLLYNDKQVATVDQIQNVSNFKGLKIQVTSSTAATIAADSILLTDSNNQFYIAKNASLTLATGTIGANGLDTGILAANAWYYLYAIYNPTTQTTACLMSLSATIPTLPIGYTYFARVGALRLDSSKYLMRTLQYGRKSRYVATTSTNTTGMLSMATANGSSTWVAVSTVSFVPPTAYSIDVTITNSQPGYCSVAPNNNYGANHSTVPIPPTSLQNAASYGSYQAIESNILLESTNVYYITSGSNGGLYCRGWEDNL